MFFVAIYHFQVFLSQVRRRLISPAHTKHDHLSKKQISKRIYSGDGSIYSRCGISGVVCHFGLSTIAPFFQNLHFSTKIARRIVVFCSTNYNIRRLPLRKLANKNSDRVVRGTLIGLLSKCVGQEP